jgi:PAS domain S-box-containing protein
MRAPTMFDLSKILKSLSDSFVPVAVMAVFMVMSMSLLSAATENSSQFGRMHLVLVVVNVIGLIVLVGLIGVNFIRLIRQYRRKAIGSQLASRLVLIFVLLAVAPVSVVYYFSLGFLQRGIDSWFDVGVQKAMSDVLELSHASLDLRMRDLLRSTRAMSDTLADVPDTVVLLTLNDLRNESNATELTLLTQSGRVIASSTSDTTAIIPNRPEDMIFHEVQRNKSYVGLSPVADLGLHVQVAINIPSLLPGGESRVLYALYPIADRINELANSVEASLADYKRVNYLRKPLKNSFVLTLSLVLLVSLLTAIWAAFFSAQRLVAPIRILAIGTRAVAAGNYDKKLPITSKDEMGALVQSFTEMTEKLAQARDETEQSRQQVERERAYLRAVLGRLSSGVMTLDRHFKLRVVNTAANLILEADVEKASGKPLQNLTEAAPHLREFVDTLTKHLQETDKEWREEVTISQKGVRRILMCQGASLQGIKGLQSGFVIVFDDVTEFISAQRDAAWGEVARRLAHEIKNPLTPIQLSAERLRRKYLSQMKPEDADVLDRSTHTIVQQVESMKEMVKAFSEYARAPKMELQILHLDEVVEEVLDLYRGDESALQFEVSLNGQLPVVEADAGRLRQLLHNLIKNAIESTAGMAHPSIMISLTGKQQGQHCVAELRVSDNGPGIPEHLLNKLFEPNTTTKTKGSGLGLAVVKRIVEEHGGDVYAENRTEGGASVIVVLPALAEDNKTVPGIVADVQ